MALGVGIGRWGGGRVTVPGCRLFSRLLRARISLRLPGLTVNLSMSDVRVRFSIETGGGLETLRRRVLEGLFRPGSALPFRAVLSDVASLDWFRRRFLKEIVVPSSSRDDDFRFLSVRGASLGSSSNSSSSSCCDSPWELTSSSSTCCSKCASPESP